MHVMCTHENKALGRDPVSGSLIRLKESSIACQLNTVLGAQSQMAGCSQSPSPNSLKTGWVRVDVCPKPKDREMKEKELWHDWPIKRFSLSHSFFLPLSKEPMFPLAIKNQNTVIFFFYLDFWHMTCVLAREIQ